MRDMLRLDRKRHISAVVLHELYKLTIEKEEKEVADLRSSMLAKEFSLIPLNYDLAIASAEIRHKYSIPMADSIIAATAKSLKMTCVTDDPHIKAVREVTTKWL
ncbi:MAG: PIN domain-containing protein [Conexivisphaerales archaeon]